MVSIYSFAYGSTYSFDYCVNLDLYLACQTYYGVNLILWYHPVTPSNLAYADRGHVMVDGLPAKANLP